MEILRHDWRWEHNYFIRSEDGIAKIKQRPDQLTIGRVLYEAFFAKRREDKIIAIEEHELAAKIGLVARMYENHLCVIERNNHGHTVIAFAKSDGAVNLFRKQEVDTVTGKTTEKIGWDTDQKSKAYAIDTLKKDLKEGRCVPHSIEAFDELRVFVHRERGKMGGLKGHHDDRVIALTLANDATPGGDR